jgi:pimeloyl-ACP methyl ester carboxylesterase
MRSLTHHIPGLVLADHLFAVPLDHARPDGDQIEVFAREVVAAKGDAQHLPWLVFFQGGPGFASPRPINNSGWLKRAVQEYRVLLLDQRGTGRSTPVTTQTLARFATATAMAEYLKHFRADAIVQDAEWIRRELVGEHERWSVLGQSFGGFCVIHYLSAAPDGVKEAMITGGLPSLDRPIDDIYAATYQRVIEKNHRYYQRYGDDVARAHAVAQYLSDHDVRLPTGDRVSLQRFQQLGHMLGTSDGWEQVHYLLEEAFVPGTSGEELSYTFLRGLENTQSFDTNPLYAILHEPIYCQHAAARWSANRVLENYPEFTWSPNTPVHFTGEMIYPWMFDAYARLKPLKEAAEILAQYDAWSRLYDPAVLHANAVPCAAVIYYHDMYVERQFSEETAQQIQGMKVWVTNEYEHNGLRANGEIILDRLLGMLHGEL